MGDVLLNSVFILAHFTRQKTFFKKPSKSVRQIHFLKMSKNSSTVFDFVLFEKICNSLEILQSGGENVEIEIEDII